MNKLEPNLEPIVDQLRGTLAKMELALSASYVSIVWTDLQGRIQWCNGAFDQLVSQPRMKILGRDLSGLLSFRHEGSGDTVHPDFISLARKGHLTQPLVCEYEEEDSKRFLEIMGQPFHFAAGETNLVFWIRDVTERKIMEQKEKMFSDQALAAAGKEFQRARDLEQSYERLKQAQAKLLQSEKMLTVGQLASGVAHEVKNPLGILLNSINYLEMALAPEQRELRDLTGTMREAVKRADRIVGALLDFAKPAASERARVPLSEIIEISLSLVMKQMMLKHIEIKKEIPSDLPLIEVNANEMQQVFINLLLNAFQAMPGGGTLTIRGCVKTFSAGEKGVGRRTTDKFRPGDSAVLCEIDDTGVGIPPRQIEKVFHPFFTTKPPGEGTGLGLTVADSIVEKHGGVIRLESQSDRGTRVQVLLPLGS